MVLFLFDIFVSRLALSPTQIPVLMGTAGSYSGGKVAGV
jgi:hypothetical protein